MTGLIMFIRRLASELRIQAAAADIPGAAAMGTGDVLRGIAAAVEKAAKETLLS